MKKKISVLVLAVLLSMNLIGCGADVRSEVKESGKEVIDITENYLDGYYNPDEANQRIFECYSDMESNVEGSELTEDEENLLDRTLYISAIVLTKSPTNEINECLDEIKSLCK